jgi:hypothetical protein
MRDGIIRSQLLKSISNAVVKTFPKVYNATATIQVALDELVGRITDSDIIVIKTLVEKNIKKTHPVYTYVVKNFKRFWFKILEQENSQLGRIETNNILKISDIAKPIVIKMEDHAQSLNHIIRHNKRVHVARYNKIIVEYVATK